MASQLYEEFLDSLETQYKTGKYPLMALSAMNLKTGKIKFRAIGEANDGTDSAIEYHIQLYDRIKEVF